MARNRSVPRDEPAEWRKGTAKARLMRERVAADFRELLLAADITGSRGLLARRLAQLFVDEQSGDLEVIRASVVEIAVAAGLYAAAMDLVLHAHDERPPAPVRDASVWVLFTDEEIRVLRSGVTTDEGREEQGDRLTDELTAEWVRRGYADHEY